MPSSEFETIFDGAASIVESRCRGMVGVRTVLDDIRNRGMSPVKNVLQNRDLIIEPWIESQRLRVPLGTVKSVASELQKLNILHIWVRVHCPAVDEDEDDDVIIESSDPRQFRQALQEECPHCGQFHESIDAQYLEMFYAIHFDDQQDSFSIGRFILKKTPKFGQAEDSRNPPDKVEKPPDEPVAKTPAVATEGDLTPLNRGLVMFLIDPRGSRFSPVEIVSHALETNQRTTAIPSVNEVVITLWKWSFLSFGILAVIELILYFIVQPYMLIFVIAAYFILYALCCNFTLKAFFSGSYLPKLVATGAFGLAGILLATSRFDIDTGVGQNMPWHFSIKSGSVHWMNILGAVLFVVVGVVGMVYLQPPKNPTVIS